MSDLTYGIISRTQVNGYYTADDVIKLANLLLEHSKYYSAQREEGLCTEDYLFEKAMEEAEEAFINEGLELRD